MVSGVVAEFDDAKGYGAIEVEGGTEHFVHCTAIADGTRTIDVGTPVRFVVVPGHRGLWEAADVDKLS